MTTSVPILKKRGRGKTDGTQFNIGLPVEYEGRLSPGVALGSRDSVYTWTTDGVGNPYISATTTRVDYQQAWQDQTTTTQTLDNWGNVTQNAVTDYANFAESTRTYSNAYIVDANYTSRHIMNRLLQTVVSDGTHSATLATNYYDSAGSIGVSYVALDEEAPRTVLGYFTLAMAGVPRDAFPKKYVRGLPPYDLPLILLARLAEDRRFAGRGHLDTH